MIICFNLLRFFFQIKRCIYISKKGNKVCSSGCATPKAKRFRIPEVQTCPPAPKKRRVVPNCSSKRSPIAFFASPDIELFFFSALRNVSAWCFFNFSSKIVWSSVQFSRWLIQIADPWKRQSLWLYWSLLCALTYSYC